MFSRRVALDITVKRHVVGKKHAADVKRVFQIGQVFVIMPFRSVEKYKVVFARENGYNGGRVARKNLRAGIYAETLVILFRRGGKARS